MRCAALTKHEFLVHLKRAFHGAWRSFPWDIEQCSIEQGTDGVSARGRRVLPGSMESWGPSRASQGGTQEIRNGKQPSVFSVLPVVTLYLTFCWGSYTRKGRSRLGQSVIYLVAQSSVWLPEPASGLGYRPPLGAWRSGHSSTAGPCLFCRER